MKSKKSCQHYSASKIYHLVGATESDFIVRAIFPDRLFVIPAVEAGTESFVGVDDEVNHLAVGKLYFLG